jgi:hypothetical protein
VHLRAGRFAEALADVERLMPLVRANVAEGAHSTGLGNAYLALGEALAGLRRATDAKAALTEALRHLEDAGGPAHPGAMRARTLLAGL